MENKREIAMYFPLLRKMVIKHFVKSGLASEYKLHIRYFFQAVEIRSDDWNKGVVLNLYQKSLDHFGADLSFFDKKKYIDMFYSLDCCPAVDRKGIFCRLCTERKYFNSIEELVFDELFKEIISDIKNRKYEREVRFGDGWACFVEKENQDE